jgi:hypothetical protein
MPPDGTTNIAKSPEDLRAKVQSQVVGSKPFFFKLEAQLPKQGRTDTPLAASEKMWVVLKTYAFDGVDRHGRINPDGSEMRGDSVENKQVELIMSDRWFR